MEMKIVQSLLEGLIIVAFGAFILFWFFGPEGYDVIQASSSHAKPDAAVTILNKKLAGSDYGPVGIDPYEIGETYFYDIKITPRLQFTGTGASGVDVISLIEFKGQSVKAAVDINGIEHDTFRIGPGDAETYTLKASISTEIPPIRAHRSYSGMLRKDAKILVEGAGGPIIVYPSEIRRHYSDILKEIPDCKVFFKMECSNLKTGVYLKECTAEEPDACKASVNICGGITTIEVGSVRCSDESVYVEEISYDGGREWKDAGEEVFVSFWVANDCTYGKNHYTQMLTCINPETQKNYMLGRFMLTAGILP